MKNYIKSGNTLTLPAPYAVSSGDGMLVSEIFGVAHNDALITVDVPIETCGEFTLTALSTSTAAQGDGAYWDDTNKRVTHVATSNTLIGAFTKAKINTEVTAQVWLKP